MFRFIFLLALTLIAAFLGVQVFQNPGYALFAYGAWTIEMPLWFAVILIFLLVSSAHMLLSLLSGLWHLPETIKQWYRRRRQNKYFKIFGRAMVCWFMGENRKAQRLLKRTIRLNIKPETSYLLMSELAIKQQSILGAQKYLDLLKSNKQNSPLLVDIMQARLYLSVNEYVKAKMLLLKWFVLKPRQPYVIYLLHQVYLAEKNWEQLLYLLPRLKKNDFMSQAAYFALEEEIYSHVLRQAAAIDKHALVSVFKGLPRYARRSATLFLTYIHELLAYTEVDLAERYLRKYLSRQWDDRAIALYGTFTATNQSKQLGFAESLLQKYPHNAQLLLALGKLTERLHIYGKAHSYYQSAASLMPSFETYFALVEFHRRRDERMQADKWLERAITYLPVEKNLSLQRLT